MRNLAIALVVGAAVHVGTSVAIASPTSQAKPWPTSNVVMKEGPRVTAPFSFLKFCARNPRECAAGDEVKLKADAALWHDLNEVNRAVNSAIKPLNDTAGKDVWQLAPSQGDCEDYALTKRSKLIAKGWSPSALTLAIAIAPSYGYHVVLVARTTSGDYLLDNLNASIRPWHEVNYVFLSRQSAENPRQWISLQENNLRASM
jgi:predicted transglutaminase-like cysteine proteinase